MHPHHTCSPNIDIKLGFAKRFPLHFAQTRHDPTLDLQILATIPKSSLRVCIAPSGSCLLAALSYHTAKIGSIDVVHSDRLTLDFCRCKMALANKSPYERTQILGHAPTNCRQQMLEELFDPLGFAPHHFGDLCLIQTYGLDYIGRFESLVRFFSEQFATTPLGRILEQDFSAKLQSKKGEQNLAGLFSLFEQTFAHNTLTQLFGEQVLDFHETSFAHYFYKRFIWALKHQTLRKNAHAFGFIRGCHPDQKPPFFPSYPPFSPPPIRYLLSSLEKHFLHCAPNTYDFLDLSDTLYTLCTPNLLSLIEKVLKPQGKVLIRQLNSTVTIQDTPPLYFCRLPEEHVGHNMCFFYSKIYVGTKA